MSGRGADTGPEGVVRRLDLSIKQTEKHIEAALRRGQPGLADHFGSLLKVLLFIKTGVHS